MRLRRGCAVAIVALLFVGVLPALLTPASASVLHGDRRAYAYDAGLRIAPARSLVHQASARVEQRADTRASPPAATLPALVASVVAAEAETTQLFRAVEPAELADLAGSGQYRTVAGLEGKYFFPTQAQAENFAELMAKGGHGPFCITSGCIDTSLLSGIEQIPIAGEGPAWFVPEELLPYIRNIVNHGPAG